MTVPTPQRERSAMSWTQHAILWISRAVTFLVYLYVLAVEIILLLGFVLLLGGANPSTSFVQWVYRSLGRTMQPFRGIFAPIELGITGNDVQSIFETSVVFAMIIYGIVALAVSALLGWLNGQALRLDREEAELRRQQAIGQAIEAVRPTAQPTAVADPRGPIASP